MTDAQKVKLYLSRVRNIDKEIGAMQSALDEHNSRLTVIKASKMKEVNVQEGRGKGTVESSIVKYMNMGEEINHKIDCMIDLKKKVMDEIDRMDDRVNKTILIRRYIVSESWEEIAKVVNYEPRHVNRLHDSALEEFYNYNKKEVDQYINKRVPKCPVKS